MADGTMRRMEELRLRHALPTLVTSCALSVFATALGAESAHAQVHFTTPIQSFEQALATAKQEGKPLLLEFSTTWCGPCKVLSRELRRPRARSVVEAVHMVIYDGEAEPGMTLMQKFGISSYPFLIAVDRNGEEASRRSGYGRWADFEEWMKTLPEQAVTIEQHKQAADAAPQNAKLQLSVANRLLKSERYVEAQPYFVRAQKSGTKEVAAQAAWALLQLSAREQQQKTMCKSAEQLVSQYPGSKEAGRALRFLAAIGGPPSPTVEDLLLKHLVEIKDAPSLHALAYTAMKARAMKAAVKIAEKLEPLTKNQATHLDTLAEVAFYAEARNDKAIALGERAVEAASADDKSRYAANLERFRRNKKEPSSELVKFSSPSLELAPAERPMPMLPLSFKLRRPLQKSIRDACWQLAMGLDSVEILMLTAAKPSEHRVLHAPSTPPALAACATKIIQAVEMPAGEIISLTAEMVPLSIEEQLEEIIGNAEEGCAAQAGKTHSVRAVLRVEAGKPGALYFPVEQAGKTANTELQACIEKTFNTFKPARALLKSISFQFSED